MLDDTIAAIATATGPAGLAVVRLSGPDAFAIGERVFSGATSLADAASHTLHHGWAVWPDGGAEAGARECRPRIDEVIAALFRAPRSYTCEDVLEISCHGGDLPARRVLDACIAAGARLARPGEFTWRAFLHGRIDLAQAEAVADLIHAGTARAHELALSQLSGQLSARLAALEERIADVTAEIEARVDFAEDVGGVEVPAHAIETIATVASDLDALLAGSAYARAVREGVRVPIVGRPNVGKSSLFNALLGEARAIVTPIPGTTRDRVSEAIEVEGVRVTLSDTAGWRETADPVEALGVGLAEQAIADAAIVLWVVDGSAPLGPEDRAIAARLGVSRILVALNKSDLGTALAAAEVESLLDGAPRRTVRVAARDATGLVDLRRALAELLGAEGEAAWGGAVGNLRHAEALGRARDALGRAETAGRRGSPGEVVALELREAIGAVGEVTGRSVSDDLIDRIFSRFCIGK